MSHNGGPQAAIVLYKVPCDALCDAGTHTFRKIRLRYSIHTGTKQTAVKLTE